ncbi:MAG TPA: hypothetical protein VGN72_00675 [Tepidisphaeraceae bacterium]|nr:hypothetical protein [Tepidisphaeraceae bacterium]
MARIKLESEGIDCLLLDENLVATQWLYANAVGGIKVQVPAADSDRARQALERPGPLAGGADVLPYSSEPQPTPIAMFQDGGEAQLAATALEGRGIQVHVRADAPVGDAADFFERFSLVVDARDAEQAIAFLRTTPARSKLIARDDVDDEVDDAAGDGQLDYAPNVPQCPACGSSNVRRRFMTRRSAALSILLLGFPIPFLTRQWTCSDCAHDWR